MTHVIQNLIVASTRVMKALETGTPACQHVATFVDAYRGLPGSSARRVCRNAVLEKILASHDFHAVQAFFEADLFAPPSLELLGDSFFCAVSATSAPYYARLIVEVVDAHLPADGHARGNILARSTREISSAAIAAAGWPHALTVATETPVPPEHAPLCDRIGGVAEALRRHLP